jgi:hypothetical protein
VTARFKPTTLSGKLVKITGRVIFDFKNGKVEFPYKNGFTGAIGGGAAQRARVILLLMPWKPIFELTLINAMFLRFAVTQMMRIPISHKESL